MKLLTHVVAVPPLTDTQEMLGAYKSLMMTIGIKGAEQMPHPLSSGFTHPIPEENQKLTNEFFNTNRVLQQLVRDKVNVHLRDTRVSMTTVTFIYGYDEATDHVQTPTPG